MFINLVLGPRAQKAYREFYNQQTERINQMNLSTRAAAIIRNIEYKDWDIQVVASYKGGVGKEEADYEYIQIEFRHGDNIWKSRKWLLSEHMTDSEIIQTIFLAVKTAEEHEIRELFKYKGQAIFGPHWNLDQIANAMENKHFDTDERA